MVNNRIKREKKEGRFFWMNKNGKKRDLKICENEEYYIVVVEFYVVWFVVGGGKGRNILVVFSKVFKVR